MAPNERGLLAVATRLLWLAGEHDAEGTYRAAPEGTRDLQLEAALVGAARVSEHVQFSARLPFSLRDRVSYGASATGTGVGDVAFDLRWDPLLPNAMAHVPGLDFELSTVVPSGVAPEDSEAPLGVDAAGEGVWQLGLALGSELPFGARREWLGNARIGLRCNLAREEATTFEGTAGLGLTWTRGDVTAALSSELEWQGGPRVGGISTDQRLLLLGMSVTVRIDRDWRLLTHVRSPLPIDGLGLNRALEIEAGLATVYAGW